MATVMGKNLAVRLRAYSAFVLIFCLIFADAFVFLERGFLLAKEAQAATGDFSLFREAGGGDVLASTLNATWDTAVSQSANIQLDANSSDISLSEGGKYLVMYNAFTEVGTTGGGNRRTVASYLTLDGSTSAYGWGGGYIRDQDNDLTAYNSGAAILNATAGDNLKLVLERDDANPGGGTAVRGGTNGMSVIKLDDSLDYLRVFKNTRSADISANTAFTDVTWDTSDEVDTKSFDFTPASGDVTLKGSADQLFLVTTNVKLNVGGTTPDPRQNYELRLTIDGVEVAGTRTNTYLRYDNGTVNGTMQYVGIVKKTSASDQIFNVEVRRESSLSTATDIVENQTALSMVALPSSAAVLSLTHSANQLLTSSQSQMNWDTQINSAPGTFTHSTSLNNNQIEIAADGDYLFFSTAYTSRTSGGGRDVPKLDWRVDGSPLTYGGHGSFNRGDQGADDAFTSGSSGGTILSGLTSGQIVDLVQSDETSGTPNSEFIGARVSLQAVDISTLEAPGTTNVSVIGSQFATTSLARTDVLLGETYVITENQATRNVTSVTLTESGTVAADVDLDNIKLFYDLDTTIPYDCRSESYTGSESQFGSAGNFNAPNGTVSFSGSESISPTQAMCIYPVLDVSGTAQNAQTIEIFINNPSSDVIVTAGGTVSPTSPIGNGTNSVVENPEITLAHYQWREDDGSESGATSATGGVQDSPGLGFDTSTAQRLRLAIYAKGAGAQQTAFGLEYGEKVTTCEAVSSWVDVGESGGAWDMFDSPNLAEGSNTTNIPVADGGVSDGVGAFVTPNGGVRDASSKTGAIAIEATDYTELEYSVRATGSAVEGVSYCFRVVDKTSLVPYYASYESRVPITIRSSAIPSDLADFPVYVDLSSLGSAFWAGVQADGDDIRMTTGDGQTEIPFELVSINTGAQTGELHFKAPTLSSSVNTNFYLYYDDVGATSYAPGDTYGRNNVWTNGYRAVYHLPTTIDSTGNGFSLTASNITNSATTRVGTQSADFNGTNSIYTYSNAGTILNGLSAVTYSAWIDSDVTNTDKGFLDSNSVNGSDTPFCLRYDAGGFSGGGSNLIKGCIDTSAGASSYETLSGTQTTNWQHVVQTWQAGQALEVYLDGATASFSDAPVSQTGTVAVGSGPLFIGAGAKDSATGGWDGRIDEVRFASAYRSADWIAAEHANQSVVTDFYSVAPAEQLTQPNGALSYDVYPEAILSADVRVLAGGTQVSTIDAGVASQYVGGVFSFIENSSSRNVTGITVTESGTVDAQKLTDVELYYELDTSAPYNCESESYAGSEAQFGATATAFSDTNGTSTFTDSVGISTTATLCVYPVFSVDRSVLDGDTIEISIANPSTDVLTSSGSIGPGTNQEIDGTTTISAPTLTLSGYQWREDDGSQTGASSASGGVENTPIAQVFQNTTKRLRVAVSNEGSLSSNNPALRLEYGTKITTCENIGTWQRIDDGAAFAMASTSNLVEGSDTTNISVANGGVTDPNPTFLTPNSAQLEDSDQLSLTTLSTTQFVEIEYALSPTLASAFAGTYCFRVTDGDDVLPVYSQYPELTVQNRQDFITQRGVETVSGTGTVLTAGVDYTAPASNTRAFVRITNTSMTGAGSDTLGASRNPDDLFAYITSADDLQAGFTITRPAAADNNTRVSWEIIEYVGVAGGDNEFTVRDVAEVTYGSGALFATGTSALVTDDSDVVVFITGQLNPSNSRNDYNTGLSISSWASATDQPVFERGDADGVAAGVSYAVVEFVGANWNVQRVEHTFTSAGATETETITAVNSLLRTFVHAQKLSGDELTNLDESGHEVWLSSIGAVSFLLEGGSSNPAGQRSVAWVIENTQIGDGSMEVYRSNGLISQNNSQPNTLLYPIGTTVEPANASIWATNRTTGPGNAHPRALLGARILNTTQFELWKSDEGQNQNFRVEIVDWPVAETSIRQAQYRFYTDNDALTPTDPWPIGASDLGENTAITDTDEPLGEGERVRIRTGLFINNASLVSDSVSFKLQYARRISTCSAVSTWDDVGTTGGAEVWRAYDASPTDGTTLENPTLLLSNSNVSGTYEENNPSALNPNSAEIGQYIEYDWLVENNSAIQKSSYCFRMTQSNDTLLDGYDVYPTVRTSGYTPIINNWRLYDDENTLTPVTPLAGENVSPSAVQNGEVLKLRVSVTEVEGAPGENIKFNLQYSEYPDFRDGVTLTATTSCTGNSLWCYADGAGENNAVIDSTVLSGVGSCASGSGAGCGTVNEAQGVSGTYDQPAFSTAEHEFTLKQDGARVNAVYYFRLVDATNGVNLVASSSFPSLSTQGAVLTFSVAGINAQTVTEGITTDATTTPTAISFGSLLVDTPVETAQRLTVFANGTQGYRVFMQFDQGLLDSYGNAIASVSATNDAPSDWVSQCAPGATGCFGYHAGDNTLYDSSLRFALDNSYAGVESGPVEVMASNVPVTFDVSDVVYKTQVGFLQPAGDYTTTVRYIVIPIF